jgi:hypothetical protein
MATQKNIKDTEKTIRIKKHTDGRVDNQRKEGVANNKYKLEIFNLKSDTENKQIAYTQVKAYYCSIKNPNNVDINIEAKTVSLDIILQNPDVLPGYKDSNHVYALNARLYLYHLSYITVVTLVQKKLEMNKTNKMILFKVSEIESYLNRHFIHLCNNKDISYNLERVIMIISDHIKVLRVKLKELLPAISFNLYQLPFQHNNFHIERIRLACEDIAPTGMHLNNPDIYYILRLFMYKEGYNNLNEQMQKQYLQYYAEANMLINFLLLNTSINLDDLLEHSSRYINIKYSDFLQRPVSKTTFNCMIAALNDLMPRLWLKVLLTITLYKPEVPEPVT